jgi:hypothetical protein
MIPSLAELLENALRGAGLEATSDIWRIGESWREAVGERIAARATPVRLRRGELMIAAPEAVWRQELTLLGPEIAARINQKIGRNLVERVRLVSGEAVVAIEPGLHRRVLRPEETTQPSEAVETLRAAAPATSPEAPALRPDIADAFASLARTRAERLESDRSLAKRRRGPSHA